METNPGLARSLPERRPLSDTLVVERRYRGFSDIAHGGYVAGALAARLGETAEVSLLGRVPLERPLAVTRPEPERVLLSDSARTLAEARPARLELDIPARVSIADAEQATASYPGFPAHLVPGCFCCGPERAVGDGLRIFPGPVAGTRVVAAPWTPHAAFADADGSVRPEFLWAALDCPQLWALIADARADSQERVVTAAMTARIDARVQAGKRHVVVAWPLERSGRTVFAGAALRSEDGDALVVGQQRAVFVTGWGVPLGLDRWSTPDS